MKRLEILFTHAIFISICAVAMALQTFQLLDLSIHSGVLLLVFMGTCCSYNMYRLVSLFPYNQSFSLARFVSRHRLAFLLILLTGTVMLVEIFRSPELRAPVIISSTLTLLYCLPLLPLQKPGWFTKAGFLKTILLAATWAFATVCLPVFSAEDSFGPVAWHLLLSRFFFVFILCIIFDARDSEADLIRSLGSLVTSVSPGALRMITYLSFAAYAVFSVMLALEMHHPGVAAAMLFTGFVTWLFYRYSLRRRNYWFYFFGVDGLMLLSALATFLATI